LLQVLAATESIVVHVPRIIAHVRNVDAQSGQKTRIDTVGAFVSARGGTAEPGPFGSVKVCWPIPSPPPLVSLIVPTRDKLELLRPCVDSILLRTSYAEFEVLIVDNGSADADTLRYLQDIRGDQRVRVLSYPHAYNYSAINNYAARLARGSYLCLLNNDTEVVSADWLTEMMRYAVRSDIGAVGAKLLYADGSIQHAGVVVGIGEAAGHAHRHLPANDAGYFCHAHVAQFVSAVTGACLVVDKRKFLAVGGLDEEQLAIAYNDVDLCLKLERAGWHNVYVPHAVLIHHESKSRAKDHAPSRIDAYRRELLTFQERWGAKDYQDPLLNPNLDRSSETFVIRF
jgi:GT2 family glycosyltransferase